MTAVGPLDFFSRVVNVHFGGGPWVVVSLGGLNVGADFASGSISFPQQAGGTPGINILDFGVYPVSITAADLVAKKISAGFSLPYFGARAITGFGDKLTLSDSNIDVFGFSHATQIIFQAPSAKPFDIRVRATAGAGVVLLGVSVVPIDAAVVKPGMSFPQFGVVEAPSPKSACYDVGGPEPLSVDATFTIDPAKLTVSGGN
jgi:hypothetical protein